MADSNHPHSATGVQTVIHVPQIIEHVAGTCRKKKVTVTVTTGQKTIAVNFGGSAYDTDESIVALAEDLSRRGSVTVRMTTKQARKLGAALSNIADQKDLEDEI